MILVLATIVHATSVHATFVQETFVQVTSVQAAISLEPLIRSWSNFEYQAAMVLATTDQDTSIQGTFDHAKNIHSTIIHVTIEISVTTSPPKS